MNCAVCDQPIENEYQICDECETRMMQNAINTISPNLKSRYAEDRYFNSIDILDHEPKRKISVPKQLNNISIDEHQIESFDFFSSNKKNMEEAFRERLIEVIGEDKTNEFINLIVNYWYPNNKRTSKKIQELKSIIKEYCVGGRRAFYVRSNCIYTKKRQLTLGPKDIGCILQINQDLMNYYLDEWLALDWEKSSNFLYFRRGLILDNKPLVYHENDFINSYTLSISVSEQFATQGKDGHYIVSGEYALFDGRILFFSPFIKGLPASQLELGIIPSDKEFFLKEESLAGSICELVLIEKE